MSLEVECPMLPLENYLPTLSCERQKGGEGKCKKRVLTKEVPFSVIMTIIKAGQND